MNTTYYVYCDKHELSIIMCDPIQRHNSLRTLPSEPESSYLRVAVRQISNCPASHVKNAWILLEIGQCGTNLSTGQKQDRENV